MRPRLATIALPLLISTHGIAADEEESALRSREIECCAVNGACETVTALTGCRSATPSGASEDPAERRILEETAPLDWLVSDGGPFVTPRGRLAEALVSARIEVLVVGEVEDAYSYEGPRLGGWGINTWCTIRVESIRKGTVDEPEVIVHFLGGQLPSGKRSYLSHEPRCTVGERGIFSLYSVDGALHPDDGATFAMRERDVDWSEHPLLLILDELSEDLGGL